MTRYIALRGRRLLGGVPARPSLAIINTDGNHGLSSAFQTIRVLGGRAKMDSLFILCHGFAGSNERAGMSVDAGGMGLLLGRECLLHANVGMWRAIRNSVENIVVYACAAADTSPGNAGTDADGRYLMSALALHTNAVVFAADRIQWYGTTNNLSNGAFQWGDWEGKLTAFYPDAVSSELVPRAPTEFADVVAGK